MNKKMLAAVLIALTLTIVCAACGKESTKEVSSEEQEAVQITYKVGTEATFPPFDMVNKETKEFTGFDIDLMNAIAKDQGFKIEWVDMGFDGLIPALQAGNIDIIASGMDATDERKEKVDFSIAYFRTGQVLAIKAGNTEIKRVDDLTPEMKAGGQIGTTGADFATELYEAGQISEAKIYSGLDVAIDDLMDGTIDVLINDLPVTKAYMKKMPGSIEIAGDVLNAESYGFAVQKGNSELLEELNAGIENLTDDGRYEELYAKWFE